jgi:cobalt-precorrin 5A hydrolase / precorrin-3B C17-methyltransferase
VRVLAISVTERGRLLATRMPFEHAHGDAGATVRARWREVDAFVLVLATGAAVRIVAPLLEDKGTDPAVVCVDEAGRFAVALCGGHRSDRVNGATGGAGANMLARQVASIVGAEPVVTTATDATGTCPLDALPGFLAGGDVAGVTAAILDGRPPALDNAVSWPLPSTLPVGAGPERLIVTDRVVEHDRGVAVLRPPTLVAGIGTSTGAPPEEVAALLDMSLAEAGLDAACVAEVATIERRAAEPAIHALGRPLRLFPAETLRSVNVPTPSFTVQSAVGTPSVAEAAALLAAGPGAELVVTKRTSAHAALAVARRQRPRGYLAVVGLGPGDPRHRTAAADTAVRHCDIVIGYSPYVDQCADLIGPHHEVVRSPIGSEEDRARTAVEEAGLGRRVALVCSGDAGVYAMASVALDQAAASGGAALPFDLEVVPGITAATAAAAAFGAPLGHDHAAISLSDLLTPWAAIESRLQAVAAADLAVSLYNPRSRGRPWQLDAARRILLGHRAPSTPVGVATDLSRAGERVRLTTLADLDPEEVGMTTCVVVGSSATRVANGRMVTPRGYRG